MAERMTASCQTAIAGTVAVLIPVFNDHGRLTGTLESLARGGDTKRNS